jgi:hypothetical protein
VCHVVYCRSLPDIIGKGGACIKALQLHTGVKISTPENFSRTSPSGETILPSKVKISLAGSRDKVVLARSLILDLTKYYHTPVTHPGVCHVEMDVPANYYSYIIGAKGSEIKHIQANFKVSVHIPNAETLHQSLLIVGEEAAVLKAEAYILKLVEKVEAQQAERAKAEAEGIALGESAKAKYAIAGTLPPTGAITSASGAAASSNRNERRAPRGASGAASDIARANAAAAKEEAAAAAEAEDWMNEFAPRKSPINLGAMLPASAKFAPAAAAPAVNASEEGGAANDAIDSASSSSWNGGAAALPVTKAW